MDEICTQPATQQVPRRKHLNIMLDEQEEADIICILLPTSPAAHEAVELTAEAAPQHILQNRGISHIYNTPDEDPITADDAEPGDTRPGDSSDDTEDTKHSNPQLTDSNHSKWEGPAKDIALRFSSKVHNLALGFMFGRSAAKCDLLLGSIEEISQRHFRIFMKNNGSLMIEDTSTNGTFVDEICLRSRKANRAGTEPNTESQHTLCNGDTIELPLKGNRRGQSVRFSVKMLARSDVGAEKYLQNCIAYIKCVEQAERQHGFLMEAMKNGKAPVILPVSKTIPTEFRRPIFLT